MNFLPRLRQACQPAWKGGGPGSDASPIGLSLPDPDEEANVAEMNRTCLLGVAVREI